MRIAGTIRKAVRCRDNPCEIQILVFNSNLIFSVSTGTAFACAGA